MAFTNSLPFAQNQDIATGVVTDATDYGVSGNPLRSATANYLLWSKTDQDGVRTFDNPAQGTVTSNLSYTVNTPEDGYYEGILMRFTPYNAGANYVEQQESGGVVSVYASVFYYASTGKVYKAIADSTGQDPEDTDFFQEVPIAQMYTLIDNTNVDVYIQDYYINVRANQCLNEILTGGCACGCDGDLSKIRSALIIKYKIMAADSAFDNDNPEQMEKIIRDVEETCSTC